MSTLREIQPSIRVANYYRFRRDDKSEEIGRIGYCYAFHLFESGRGRVVIEGHTYSLQKGDLLFIPPNQFHSFYSDPEYLLSSYNFYCELWTDFPMETNQHLSWGAAHLDNALFTAIHSCSELDQLPSVIRLQHHELLGDLLVHIFREWQKTDLYAGSIVSHLLAGWILKLIQVSQSVMPYDYRIRRIIDQMEQRSDPIGDYDSWLKQSGLKKTQFHELFKKTTGFSPKSYWIKVKMKQAAANLWESNRSITDIAAELGYSSIHYFTNQFSSFYGVSPSEFRKRRITNEL